MIHSKIFVSQNYLGMIMTLITWQMRYVNIHDTCSDK